MFVYILLLYNYITIVHTSAVNYIPIPEKLWTEKCKKNTYLMNDCNWCRCSIHSLYECKSRLCEVVDMFGHFKDTIQEVDVGMEGHGSWRSIATPCEPGVQYRRGTVHCVCDQDGNWPNPVCRDLFRILHSIEITENVEESTSQICSPTKLYLVGCNACFCPSSGILNASLCTNRTCKEDDPVLAPKEPNNTRTLIRRSDDEDLDIYALCISSKKYTIGSQQYICLNHNRLICDGCLSKYTQLAEKKQTLCSGKVGSIVTMDCNLCKCDNDNFMYCSTKKCTPINNAFIPIMKAHVQSNKLVKAPIDDQDCVPGTKYQRDCNTCYCKIVKGRKIFQCTVNPCHGSDEISLSEELAADCVKNTTYEVNCQFCHCEEIDGEKYQSCTINNKCGTTSVMRESRSQSLNSLHGYCEPLHRYRRGCNVCKCLDNGKIVKCTTRICGQRRSHDPVTVEIVPLHQTWDKPCPKWFSYKVGCNVCFCLANGNALCTAADCSKKLDLNHLNSLIL